MMDPDQYPYDVSTYTDLELFQILDINHPTDKELEARILQMVSTYEPHIDSDGEARLLYQFFLGIYDRFFETDDPLLAVEGFEPTVPKVGEGGRPPQFRASALAPGSKPQPTGSIAAADPLPTDPNELKQLQTTLPPQLGYTKSVEYATGSLNPLIKETIKRVISVDSQFRDKTVYPLSTEFTFNLSDVLHDVVSLKLYSVQIPYNWQTINGSFGGNFIYLKAATPGLNNGNYDYQVAISSGNYTPNSEDIGLVPAINNAYNALRLANPDVSFGTTGVTYNPVQANATFTLDITNNFNETYYYVDFPYFTAASPSDPTIRSLPELLGFAQNQYVPASIESSVFGNPATTCNVYESNSPSSSPPYYKNNVITIHNYQGPGAYDPSQSTVLDTVTLTLTPGYNLPLSSVISNLQLELQSVAELRSSTFEVIDTSYIQPGTSQYRMTVCQNRKRVKNLASSKMVVVFPPEDASNNQPLWCGASSTFRFPRSTMEVNEIVSELASQTTNYVIPFPGQIAPLPNFPQLIYYCVHPDYAVDVNQARINDASFSVAASPAGSGGYNLTEYFVAIQAGMTQLYTSSNQAFDASINNTTSNYHVQMTFNIRKLIPFRTPNLETGLGYVNNFALDISGSVLSTICRFSSSSSSSTVMTELISTSTFPFQAAYDVTSENNTMYIVSQNNLQSTRTAVSLTAPVTYNSTAEFIGAINAAFGKSGLAHNLSMPNSNVSFTISGTTVSCTLSLNIEANMTNADYQVNLYETPQDPSGSWHTYLGLNQTTSPTDPHGYVIDANGHVTGTTTVTDNQITLDASNHYFYVSPISPSVPSSPNLSVYDPNGGVYIGTLGPDPSANTLLVDLVNDPSSRLKLGETYTKTEIANAINAIFASSPVSAGSHLDLTIHAPYTTLRLNVNRTYHTDDYEFVLYDRTLFTHCNYGYPRSVQNATYDSTLGWLMGFRSQTIYGLGASYASVDSLGNRVYVGTSNGYTYDPKTHVVTITGDTSININLYNYFMIILDDYTQNHLNDGLVTVTSTDSDVALPSYATRMNYKCDPQTGKYSVADSTSPSNGGNRLTANQIYSANQILNAQINKQTTGSSGPFVQDVFGLIPVKTSGLTLGQSYIEFGGTLQIQERLYFGPVNIRRMSVKLINDKGGVVDLNNVDWSFSLIAEQLYAPNTGKPSS
jgi:hypothetical protein